jgi:hypothetical protein
MDNTKNIIKKVTQGENEYWSVVEGEPKKTEEDEIIPTTYPRDINTSTDTKIIDKIKTDYGYDISDFTSVKVISDSKVQLVLNGETYEMSY